MGSTQPIRFDEQKSNGKGNETERTAKTLAKNPLSPAKMRAPISRFLSKSVSFLHRTTPLSSGTRHLCAVASPEARTKKLERIADDLLKLNRIELYDYSILFSHKLGLNRYGSAVSIPAGSSGDAVAAGETKAAEKTAFDVKLEKFDAAFKIKVIKEIRAFTELGLKEAKDLVEKAPVVVKKGITKEEAEKIMEKLKAVGAIVVLE